MLVVIGCSSKKRHGRHPVEALYTGKVFEASLRAARSMTSDESIRVLSGQHGLLKLTDSVEEYDTFLVVKDMQQMVMQQAAELDKDVTLFLTKKYEAVALAVWPEATSIFHGSRGGISQLARCYKIIGAAA